MDNSLITIIIAILIIFFQIYSDKKKKEAKLRRWQGISESAAKQSGRLMIPEAGPVMSFKEALALAGDFDLAIIPFEHADDMKKTGEIIENAKPGTDIGIFIGPEGGFEDTEVELAESLGVKPITLGKRILRTETAGMAVLSVLAFRLEGL